VASVRIASKARNDPRFVIVAALLGYADADHAIMKVSRIWDYQTETYTPERPTYVVDPVIVDALLGVVGGCAVLVKAGLAEEVPAGLRIRGSEGQIEWLWNKRNAGRKGGRPKTASVPTPDDCSDDYNQEPAGSHLQGRVTAEPNPPSLTTSPSDPPSEDQHVASPSAPLALEPQPTRKPRDKAKPVEGYTETVAVFDQAFRAASQGKKPTWTAIAGANLKRLLKAHGAAEVQRRIGVLFSSPPRWLSPPFTLETLVRHFDALAVSSAANQSRAGPRNQAEDQFQAQLRRVAELEARERGET